jgi:hypothetical protein
VSEKETNKTKQNKTKQQQTKKTKNNTTSFFFFYYPGTVGAVHAIPFTLPSFYNKGLTASGYFLIFCRVFNLVIFFDLGTNTWNTTTHTTTRRKRSRRR